MPSTDELRQAVVKLSDRYPDSRLTWSLDSTKRYWRNDRTAESIVVERQWDEGVDVGARLDAMARDESLDPPLTLIRYPNHIGLKMSHAVGDGRLFLTIISTVLQTALTGEVAQWPVERSGRFPLSAAALRTFGRNPLLLNAAFKDREPQGSTDTAGETRAWTPSRRSQYGLMSRELADEMINWGKEYVPRASRFALQVALVLRALNRVGMRVSRDVKVIVDLRRYIGWRYIDGNFVAGVPMLIDWQMTPEAISSTVKSTNLSGRPLAGQVLASMITFLRGQGAMPLPTAVNSQGLPRITFSGMGRSPDIERVPFLDSSPSIYAGSVPPEGPLGLTVITAETARAMTFSATFHDNTIDPRVVAEAMGLLCADPVGLLSESPEAP